jgi:hypothetical protein
MATLVKSASVFLDRLELDDMMRILNYIAQGTSLTFQRFTTPNDAARDNQFSEMERVLVCAMYFRIDVMRCVIHFDCYKM